eukprot:2037557-Rhodomonas_salina.2
MPLPNQACDPERHLRSVAGSVYPGTEISESCFRACDAEPQGPADRRALQGHTREHIRDTRKESKEGERASERARAERERARDTRR